MESIRKMEQRRIKKPMKLAGLLMTVFLCTTVIAVQVSQYLMVDINVSDADYSVEWVSVAPTTLSVLDVYEGELKFSTLLDPGTGHPFDVVFTIESMPAGAAFTDVSWGIQLNAEPFVVRNVLTGMSVSISRVIGAGTSFIDHTIELYIGYPGAWQFSIYMSVP